MNKDIIQGNWKEIKGKVKTYWGKLTDDDFLKMNGTSDELEGYLQKRYGYEKEQAKKEIQDFLNREGLN